MNVRASAWWHFRDDEECSFHHNIWCSIRSGLGLALHYFFDRCVGSKSAKNPNVDCQRSCMGDLQLRQLDDGRTSEQHATRLHSLPPSSDVNICISSIVRPWKCSYFSSEKLTRWQLCINSSFLFAAGKYCSIRIHDDWWKFNFQLSDVLQYVPTTMAL